jgi:signal transduction histidine kinase
MIAALSGIMVKQKRQALEKRVAELSRLLAENQGLQNRIRNAHRRTTEINELFLRRVSAELHDAPAQLIGFALLRLDALRPQPDGRTGAHPRLQQDRTNGGRDEVETIRSALAESLSEIRNISAGLAPPELADVSLAEALEIAASRHAERTGTPVDCRIGRLPERVDPCLKISLYRLAQEGLNNAFRHAGGRGQELIASCEDELLEVVISDDGPARDAGGQRSCSSGLGIAVLRARIESLGGALDFHSQPGRGARLTARFNLAKMEFVHA